MIDIIGYNDRIIIIYISICDAYNVFINIDIAEETTMENREGQAVPQVTFPVRQDHEWVNLTTDAEAL